MCGLVMDNVCYVVHRNVVHNVLYKVYDNVKNTDRAIIENYVKFNTFNNVFGNIGEHIRATTNLTIRNKLFTSEQLQAAFSNLETLL